MSKSYRIKEVTSTETATPLGLVAVQFKAGVVTPTDPVEMAACVRLVEAGLAEEVAADKPEAKPAAKAKE